MWALPQGIFTFSSAQFPRGCRLGICSGTVLYGPQGNTCFNIACPTGFQGFSAPGPAALLPLLFPWPWSQSCFSHFFPHTDLWRLVLFWMCFLWGIAILAELCRGQPWALCTQPIRQPTSPETPRPLLRVTTGLTVKRKKLKADLDDGKCYSKCYVLYIYKRHRVSQFSWPQCVRWGYTGKEKYWWQTFSWSVTAPKSNNQWHSESQMSASSTSTFRSTSC